MLIINYLFSYYLLARFVLNNYGHIGFYLVKSTLFMGKRVMNTQKGFTLIELMIVVAIIGILAAIAIPQYQNYIARSQVTEAFTLMNGAKTAIQDNLQANSCTANVANDDTINGKYGTLVINKGAPTATATATGCTMKYTFGSGASSLLVGTDIVAGLNNNGTLSKGTATKPVPADLLPKSFS